MTYFAKHAKTKHHKTSRPKIAVFVYKATNYSNKIHGKSHSDFSVALLQ